MKVYLSGSTQENNTGVAGYETEETRMQHLADLVKHFIEKGKGNIEVFRNTGSMSLQQTVADSNNKSPDIHVALHSNAGGGKGTECYYFYATSLDDAKLNGKRLATLIYNAVAPLTINSDRGCKADNTLYSNGLYETRETNAIACLIEIMFHDNISDVQDYYNKQDAIALAIAKAIYEYFGISYSQETETPINNSGFERDKGIKIIASVSNWAEDYIREFDVIQNKGINVWGLVNKIYNAK